MATAHCIIAAMKSFCMFRSRLAWSTAVCAFACGMAFAQAEGGGSALSEEELVARARAIVDAYAVDHEVSVPALPNGLRVIGVRFEQEAADGAASGPETPQLDLPDWFDPAWILGRIAQGRRTVIKLLWRVEPTDEDSTAKAAAQVELACHQGYARVQQEGGPVSASPGDQPPGTVFWTEHPMGVPRTSPPGQYNLILTVNAGGARTMPLGPVMLGGWSERLSDVASRLRQAFPTAAPAFAGRTVLARWHRTTVTIPEPERPARTLLICSTADWMEDKPNLTEVARVAVRYADGFGETFPLLLGRHSSSHHYDFHSRSGMLRQERAPIAWSTSARLQTVEADAHVYAARYELTRGHGEPAEVAVRFVAEEGTLTVYGVATTP